MALDEVIDTEAVVKSFSPRPTKPVTMDFPDAMREVIAGKKIAKLEWAEKGEPECYALLNAGMLQIFRGASFHAWNVSDGDLAGEDYIVVK